MMFRNSYRCKEERWPSRLLFKFIFFLFHNYHISSIIFPFLAFCIFACCWHSDSNFTDFLSLPFHIPWKQNKRNVFPKTFSKAICTFRQKKQHSGIYPWNYRTWTDHLNFSSSFYHICEHGSIIVNYPGIQQGYIAGDVKHTQIG